MCRNIRVLHHFEPPTTRDEIHDAALQFVRKVSGINRPAQADQAAFVRAVEAIAATTEKLLADLKPRTVARTREQERERARSRWKAREERLTK